MKQGIWKDELQQYLPKFTQNLKIIEKGSCLDLLKGKMYQTSINPMMSLNIIIMKMMMINPRWLMFLHGTKLSLVATLWRSISLTTKDFLVEQHRIGCHIGRNLKSKNKFKNWFF